MKNKEPIVTTLAGIVVAAAFTLSACTDKVVVKDYSGFERFEFGQAAGLGFCPDLDGVFTATIKRSDSDQLTLSNSPRHRSDVDAEQWLPG